MRSPKKLIRNGGSINLNGTINVLMPFSWSIVVTALSAILLSVLIFLSIASYSRTEMASGSVVPEAGIIQIVPPRSGRVDALLVEEGAHVEAGVALARIRVDETNRVGGNVQASVLLAIDEQRRSLDQQEILGQASAASEQAELEVRIDGLQKEIAAIDAQIAVQKKLVALAQADLDQAVEIATRGFVSRRDVADREELLLTRQQFLASLEQNRATKTAGIRQAERARQGISARALSANAGIQVNRAQLEKEVASAHSEQGYSLTSPIQGRVTALSLHLGDPVSPQTVAMLILPKAKTLVARLHIPAKAAGFVRIGQNVRLAFDAYPYERFGTVPGKIATLSAAPIFKTDQNGLVSPYYVATAHIDERQADKQLRRNGLMSGMTFTARITTEKRSILRWLLDPLFAVSY